MHALWQDMSRFILDRRKQDLADEAEENAEKGTVLQRPLHAECCFIVLYEMYFQVLHSLSHYTLEFQY